MFSTVGFRLGAVLLAGCLVGLPACAWREKYPAPPAAKSPAPAADKYRIGPGDSLNIFVWRYPEVSTTVPVRPDGFISAPLLEDIPAAGKTPTELARDLETQLAVYLRDPLVTVVVQEFIGVFPDQIRVLGEVTEGARALPYRDGMTLLDVMIEVGGITEFAAGNRAMLVRNEDGVRKQYNIRLNDLIRDADLSANTDIRPGDVLLVPESWF
ncbi:MAG: polysaccharide export protein [Chromatiaceae bacterium]|nr:polysaccharide export protein [Chromatiaceae bacterium]